MKSIGAMLEIIHGLCGTKDVTEWEDGFIEDMHESYLKAGKSESHLSEKQTGVIRRIHDRHFA